MSRGAIQKAIDDVCDALTASYGEELLSVYLFGSLADGNYKKDVSDINILVVCDGKIDLHSYREALRPIWLNKSGLLKQLPILANPQTLNRHLFFNPLLADHLTLHGELLTGTPSLIQVETLFPAEREARYVKMALDSSACLAPTLLSEKELFEVKRILHRLYRQINGVNDDKESTITHLFANSVEKIQKMVDSQISLKWSKKEDLEPPPLIDSLVAIYEYENQLLLVMSEPESRNLSNEILSTNWVEVANRIGDDYRNLKVTTPSQLRLWLQYESPADFYLENLIHVWGTDLISDLVPEKWRVYRHLGRLPSDLQLIDFPHAYVNASDTDLAMLIHDYQNKLLNIRLRSELLCRLEGTELRLPPDSLPDRQTDQKLGIKAIYSHLDWWANYYSDLQRSSSN